MGLVLTLYVSGYKFTPPHQFSKFFVDYFLLHNSFFYINE